MQNLLINIIMIIVLVQSGMSGLYAAQDRKAEEADRLQQQESDSAELEIDDRIPVTNSPHSYLSLFVIDTIVPGGGHFYQGNYYTGSVFAVLKLAGAFSLYYFYNELGDKRDDYRAVKNDPAADADDIQNIKRDYERSHQHVTFAVLGNIAVYFSSYIISFSGLKKLNENSIPTFDLKYSSGRGHSLKRGEIILSINLRL